MTESNAIAAFLKYAGIKKMDIKAALVDCDGVLYDSMKNHSRAWVKLMSKNGIKCTRDEFYAYEGMVGTEILKMKFRTGAGKVLTDDEARDLYGVKGRYFRELGEVPMMPGTHEALKVLKQEGLKCFLVTGSQQQSMLDRIAADYDGIFDEARVTGFDVRHGKPHPEPYLKGAIAAGVAPNQCIVLENAPLGVQSGHTAGCFTIGLTTGPMSAKDLYKSGADIVYESPAALAQALPALLQAIKES